MPKPPPPLRDYQQMVRVVREQQKSLFTQGVPYQLGKAYGKEAPSADETRMRSLDEIGINSRSPSHLQDPAADNNFNARETTSLYHQLSPSQQQYFSGQGPNHSPTRQDGLPGTKTRSFLGSHYEAEKIAVSEGPDQRDISRAKQQASGADSTNEPEASPNGGTSTPDFDTHFEHQVPGPKQTRLPIVRPAPLEGTSPTELDFRLTT